MKRVDKKMPRFQNNAHVQNVSNQKGIWTAFAFIVCRPSALDTLNRLVCVALQCMI